MAIVNTADAVKSWGDCYPTVDGSGNVARWELSRKYEKDGYESEFSQTIEQSEETPEGTVENFALKAPSAFTQAELLSLLPLAHLDEVYESQFTSVKVDVQPVRNRVDDFVPGDLDVGDLSILEGIDTGSLGL